MKKKRRTFMDDVLHLFGADSGDSEDTGEKRTFMGDVMGAYDRKREEEKIERQQAAERAQALDEAARWDAIAAQNPKGSYAANHAEYMADKCRKDAGYW